MSFFKPVILCLLLVGCIDTDFKETFEDVSCDAVNLNAISQEQINKAYEFCTSGVHMIYSFRGYEFVMCEDGTNKEI